DDDEGDLGHIEAVERQEPALESSNVTPATDIEAPVRQLIPFEPEMSNGDLVSDGADALASQNAVDTVASLQNRTNDPVSSTENLEGSNPDEPSQLPSASFRFRQGSKVEVAVGVACDFPPGRITTCWVQATVIEVESNSAASRPYVVLCQ